MAGGAGIEVAGGLVGQEQPRPVGDRAGDGDALLLAAGQFRRTVGEPGLEAEEGQEFGGPRLRLAALQPRMSWGIITFSSAENSGRR